MPHSSLDQHPQVERCHRLVRQAIFTKAEVMCSDSDFSCGPKTAVQPADSSRILKSRNCGDIDGHVAIHTRRSIRDYEQRAVGQEIIADNQWDAAHAPTTPVSGPFLFHVIEGAARIADLGERAKQYTRQHRLDDVGYSWAERPDFKVFLDVPVVIVISGHADDRSRSRTATAQDRISCLPRMLAGSAAAGLARRCFGCAALTHARNSVSPKVLHPLQPLRSAMRPRCHHRIRANGRRSCGLDGRLSKITRNTKARRYHRRASSADIHDARRTTRSNQRPDTLMQGSKADRSMKTLAMHGRTIHTSGSIASYQGSRRHVRKTPDPVDPAGRAGSTRKGHDRLPIGPRVRLIAAAASVVDTPHADRATVIRHKFFF